MLITMDVQICYINPYKEIARQVRRARENKGLTQTQLASLAGVSRFSICRMESGKRFNIDWIEMCLIEQILEIEIKKPTLTRVG